MARSGYILDNPLVEFAIILGVLAVLAGIAFFTDLSAGLDDAVTMGAELMSLVAVLWIFGPKGPLSKN